MLFLLSLLGLGGCAGGPLTVDNSTVKQLDLERFMGRWYEIARYDHRFERGMSHVTATYSLLGNGRIRVVNEGVRNGKHKTARQAARRFAAGQAQGGVLPVVLRRLLRSRHCARLQLCARGQQFRQISLDNEPHAVFATACAPLASRQPAPARLRHVEADIRRAVTS